MVETKDDFALILEELRAIKRDLAYIRSK